MEKAEKHFFLIEKWTDMEITIMGEETYNGYQEKFPEGGTEVLVDERKGVILYANQNDDESWQIGVKKSEDPERYELIVDRLGDRPIW